MRYQPPTCTNVDLDGVPCVQRQPPGRTMRVLGERHPSFGPHYRPGVIIFQCERCESVRAIEEERLGRYLRRTR